MKIVKVRYHRDDDQKTWWADSPDAAGFVATASSFQEVRRLAIEGIVFAFEEEDANISVQEMGVWDHNSTQGPAAEIVSFEYRSAFHGDHSQAIKNTAQMA